MSNPKLSIIITAKDTNDQKLKDLLCSIQQQTFKNYEVIVETKGDSESAKGMALKKAKGNIVCILASDNYLQNKNFIKLCINFFKNKDIHFVYPQYYFYKENDNVLNRYFALFGCNDPIPLYLDKNDKLPYYKGKVEYGFKTFGDNGFFIRKEILLKSNLKHYYHIDNIYDIWKKGYRNLTIVRIAIWQRTGGNRFKFCIKRYKYADKFNTSYPRWNMVETTQDYLRLLWFIFCTITIIQPLYLSFKGYRVIKDKAWFLHPIVCWFTLITYGIWTLKRLTKNILIHASSF